MKDDDFRNGFDDDLEDDGELLEQLARILAVATPVPSDVLQSARISFDLRSRGGDVAELVYDSVLDEDRLLGVRGNDGSRQLTFVTGDVIFEVEMQSADRRLVGQIEPPAAGRLQLRHPRGSAEVDVDELGRFVADTVPSGPVSLRWQPFDPAAGAGAVTDWVTL